MLVRIRLELIHTGYDIDQPHAGPELVHTRPIQVTERRDGVLEHRTDHRYPKQVTALEGCSAAGGLAQVEIDGDPLALAAHALQRGERRIGIRKQAAAELEQLARRGFALE